MIFLSAIPPSVDLMSLHMLIVQFLAQLDSFAIRLDFPELASHLPSGRRRERKNIKNTKQKRTVLPLSNSGSEWLYSESGLPLKSASFRLMAPAGSPDGYL